MTPEQPLVMGSRWPRDQRRHQTLPLPLSQPSFQPRDQPSRFRLLLALEQPLLRLLPQPPLQPPLWPSVLPLPRFSRNLFEPLPFTATCKLVTANSRPAAAAHAGQLDFRQPEN